MNKKKLAVTLTTTALVAGGIAVLNRQEIKKLLIHVEPAALDEERMRKSCYETNEPVKRVEYVCPNCGERTLYPIPQRMDLEECKATLEVCSGIIRARARQETLTLDASSSCRKCNPGKVKSELVLSIRYADGQTEMLHGVTTGDLVLLAGLLGGRILADAPEVRQSTLGKLTRLRELTGGASQK